MYARLSSNIVNNLSEGMYLVNLNVNAGKWEICGITYKLCDCFLEYTNLKDDLIEAECLYCS